MVKGLVFWILSLTWGIIMTFIGGLFAVVLLCSGHKPKVFNCFVYFETKGSYGGFNLGAFFVCGKNPSEDTIRHEAGHGVQNIMFGPFMPFFVSIPSFIRYHYREYLVKSGRKRYSELPDYYSVWYEKQATELGAKLK